MPRLSGIRRLLHITPNRAGIERAVDDELRFHLEMTMRDLVKNGMTPDEARAEATRRFGDLDRTRERLATIDRARAGQERRAEWWSAAGQDVRYALRGLRLKPGFTAAVVLTFGLGIGANAAMFGIVDRLLFRPPPYRAEAERVHKVYLARIANGKEFVGTGAAYQRYLDFANSARTMDVFAAYSQQRMAVGSGESARELHIGAASATLWKLFDARPVLGRFFTADEDRDPGAAKVVVLAHRFWQSEYGGARDVVGKTIAIGPSPCPLIGGGPPRFAAADNVAQVALIPVTAAAVDGFSNLWERNRERYNISWVEISARRKPGVTIDAANAD